MPATSSLNPRSQFFEGEFKRAWDLFRNEEFEAANNIARKLLLEPALGTLHQAGCHLLLAHGPDEYLAHAEKAVELYKSLYDGDEPTERQKQSQLTMIEGAEKVLERARKDAAKEVPMSNEDFLQQLEEEDDGAEEAAAEEERMIDEENEAWLEESRARVRAAAEAEAEDTAAAWLVSAGRTSQQPAPAAEEEEEDVGLPRLPPPSKSRRRP